MDKGLLNILPERYYIGQVIENEKFEDLSDNTEFLNKRIRAYVRKITILYTIRNSNNTNEIQIINVDVNTNEINPKDIFELIRSIQRGILYKTVIILTSEKDVYSKYKVAVPFCHNGVNKDIMVIDSCEETYWCSEYDLLSIFDEAAELLNNGKNDISLIRDKIVEKVRKYPAILDLIYSGENYSYVDAFNTIFSFLTQEEIEDILYDVENEDLVYYSDDCDEESFDDLDFDYCSSDIPDDFSKRNRIIQALEEKDSSLKGFFTVLEELKTYFEGISDEDIIKQYEDYMGGWYENFLKEKEWEENDEDDDKLLKETEEYLKTIGVI